MLKEKHFSAVIIFITGKKQGSSSDEHFLKQRKEFPMEEISLGVKVVIILICLAAGALLVCWDKIFKKKEKEK